MKIKRLTALFLALVLTALAASTCLAADSSGLAALEKKAAEYVQKTVSSPAVGSTGGEWAVLGLARSSAAVPDGYYAEYYASLEKELSENNGVLNEKKYSDYSRAIVALSAIGVDARNVAGYDLVSRLGDYDSVIWQGINGPSWALLALDSMNYPDPEAPEGKTRGTREAYIECILSRRLASGGWSLKGKGGEDTPSDPDVTAMVLQALSKYTDRADVKEAVDSGIACLSGLQRNNGGFATYGNETLESSAQVIVALCELGIEVDDERFVKNGNSVLDAFLEYISADGGFKHVLSGAGGSSNNLMASEQGLYCLAALNRALGGKNSLYNMSDAKKVNVQGTNDNETVGLASKHADVKKVPVISAGKSFGDIAGAKSESAIKALAERGIIDGMSEDVFAPDETMTRAQFAAIVVRALGLEAGGETKFSDVAAKEWFAPYVAAASRYGIVEGRSESVFAPNDKISRQEAAIMVSRAAKLCGMDTAVESTEQRNILAPFGDYTKTASWAREYVAFCYRENILDNNDLNIEPERAILRGEIAQMVYNVLVSAKLI